MTITNYDLGNLIILVNLIMIIIINLSFFICFEMLRKINKKINMIKNVVGEKSELRGILGKIRG